MLENRHSSSVRVGHTACAAFLGLRWLAGMCQYVMFGQRSASPGAALAVNLRFDNCQFALRQLSVCASIFQNMSSKYQHTSINVHGEFLCGLIECEPAILAVGFTE